MKKNSPHTSILIVVVLSFLVFIPVSINYVPLFHKPQAYYLLFSVLVLLVILSYKKVTIINKKLFYTLFLYYLLFLYSFSSSLWSDYSVEVMWRSIIIYLPGAIIAILVFYNNQIDNTIVKLMKIHMYLGLIVSLIGLFLYISSPIYWHPDNYSYNSFNFWGFDIGQVLFSSSNIWRLSSITGNPNIAGYILFLSISSSVTLLFLQKQRKSIMFLFLVIQIVFLILTFSRTSIMITGLYIFIFLILILTTKTGKNGKRLVFLFLTIGFIAFFSLLFYLLLGENNNQRLSLDLAGRSKAWISLIEIFEENPIFGIGFNTSVEAMSKNGINDINHAHNMYLGLLSELGLIGFILLFIFFFSIIITILSLYIPRYRRNITYRDYILYIFISLVTLLILVHQIFEFHLFRISYLNIIWSISLFSTLQLRQKIAFELKGDNK